MRSFLLGEAFVEVFETSNAPEVDMFNYLKRYCEDLDLTNFKCGLRSTRTFDERQLARAAFFLSRRLLAVIRSNPR